MVGGTDNRFFRRAGSVGYGYGLFSRRLSFEDYATMFHGNDERVDVESLGLSAQLWDAVARTSSTADQEPSSRADLAATRLVRSTRRSGPRNGRLRPR